jgi:signal peptide peptidase SppA
MPKPKKDESRNDFVGRCMSDDVMKKDFPDNAQRTAVCEKQYDNRNHKASAQGSLLRVSRALYCDAWLITAEMHAIMCSILEAHMAGGQNELERRLIGEFVSGKTPADVPSNPEDDGPRYMSANGVGVIPLQGVIGRKVGALQKSSGVTDIQDFMDMLDEGMADKSARCLMLDIDSPGGTVTGVPEAAAAVARARAVKPIMAFASGMCASAAYWVASQCDAIYAEPSATVGSIGVYSYVLDRTRAYENNGVKVDVFSSGKHKAAGLPGTALSPEQRSEMQGRVDALASMFKGTVLSMRPQISAAAMEGQTFFGAGARAAGLVDSVSTFEQAMADCLRMAALRGK